MPILRSAETFSTLRAACFVSGRDTPCLRCRLGDSSGALGLASWRQCDPAVRPSGDAWRIGIWGSSRPHPRTLGCIRSTNVHAILRNALCFLGPVFLFACGPYPYAPATKCTHHQVARKRHPPTLRVCLSLHLPLSLSLLCRRTVAAVQMTSCESCLSYVSLSAASSSSLAKHKCGMQPPLSCFLLLSFPVPHPHATLFPCLRISSGRGDSFP